jgi:hypothetical protein
MENWIPFVDGEYLVEQAYLVASDHKAVALEHAVIEVVSDRRGQRHLRGSGRVMNNRMIELLEDHDELDVVLDLGDEFKYRLKNPNIQAGKVFAPNTRSTLRFSPQSPWGKLSLNDYDRLTRGLILIDGATV